MNQSQIEQAAGINKDVAQYMMKMSTPAAKSAMSLLKMCVDFCEPCSLELLKQAVIDCKKELEDA